MRRVVALVLCVMLILAVSTPVGVGAQGSAAVFTLSTPYPGQIRSIDDDITMEMTIQTTAPILARLEMAQAAPGWVTTFKGGGNVIGAVFASPEKNGTFQVLLQRPPNVKAGSYHFLVRASAGGQVVELPLDIQLRDKASDALSFTVDFPTLTGRPSQILRYNLTLRNEGEDATVVNVVADAPPTLQTTVKVSGQEVKSTTLAAGGSTIVNVELRPYADAPAGQYTVLVRAFAGRAEVQQELTANVTGEPQLMLTAPDGLTSGRAFPGRPASFTVTVRNGGTAAANDVRMSATPPAGWVVTFEPEVVERLNIGQEVNVSATIQPAARAAAGDYMVALAGRAAASDAQSLDFRVTVLPVTIWRTVGLGLLALATAVMGVAATRSRK